MKTSFFVSFKKEKIDFGSIFNFSFVNYAQYLKQKYVAGQVTRAAATCKLPQ